MSMGHRKPFRYFIVHMSSFQRLITLALEDRRDECAAPPNAPIGWAFSISAVVFATRFDKNSIQPSL